MAKNIQVCVKCEKKILGEFRNVLMMGPKGYRRYAVHAECAGNVGPAKMGGRQLAKMKRLSERGQGLVIWILFLLLVVAVAIVFVQAGG